MITAFTVKNFKAIGDDPVRIELKPITLLFGANSAGKSSIIHALNYANEVFNNQNLNANTLGGFKRFIHNRDLSCNIFLRFDLDFKSNMINPGDFGDAFDEIVNSYDLDYMLYPRKLLSQAVNAYVEVEISWSESKQCPYIYRYETGINNERIVTVKEGAVRYFNTAHQVFNRLWILHGISLDCLVEKCIKPDFYNRKTADEEKDSIQVDEYKTSEERRKLFECLGRVPSTAFTLSSSANNINITGTNTLPKWGTTINFDTEIWSDSVVNPNHYSDFESAMRVLHGNGSTQKEWRRNNDLKNLTEFSSFDFENLFTALLVEPGEHVAKWLKIIRHLGPLREIPPRDFHHVSKYDESAHSRWATGLAAWDELLSLGYSCLNMEKNRKGLCPDYDQYFMFFNPNDTLNIINSWLVDTHRLNTGYRVLFEYYREDITFPSIHPLFIALTSGKSLADVPELANELANEILNLPEKTRTWLHDESHGLNLTPDEIGTGISQVLPVVVAVVVEGAELVAIEQPELHIHPALQVQLADLFIEQSNDRKSFLIETHSEHLLLRLLRRINETFEGELPPDVNPCTPSDVAIYYLDKGAKGMHVRRLKISEDGNSHGDWPEGFFEERRAELF